MKQLISFLLFVFLAFGQTQKYELKAGGPYDWNSFLREVQTTCTDVEIQKDKIDKAISSDPTVHGNQKLVKEVDQMLTRIILIQNMIANEFKHRDTLDNSQRTLLEDYKNKALRLRQELTELRKRVTKVKINN